MSLGAERAEKMVVPTMPIFACLQPCFSSASALITCRGKSHRTVDMLSRDLDAAVSSSSGSQTPSSSTIHHVNGLVLEPTEWVVIGLGWRGERSKGLQRQEQSVAL